MAVINREDLISKVNFIQERCMSNPRYKGMLFANSAEVVDEIHKYMCEYMASEHDITFFHSGIGEEEAITCEYKNGSTFTLFALDNFQVNYDYTNICHFLFIEKGISDDTLKTMASLEIQIYENTLTNAGMFNPNPVYFRWNPLDEG